MYPTAFIYKSKYKEQREDFLLQFACLFCYIRCYPVCSVRPESFSKAKSWRKFVLKLVREGMHVTKFSFMNLYDLEFK